MVELLVVVAIIAILVYLLLPTLARAKAKAKTVVCMNNLRQMGLVYRGFANDHNGQFPTSVSTNQGGSMEFFNWAVAGGELLNHAVHPFYQALSNDLVTPRLLLCPSDIGGAVALGWRSLQDTNLTYLVGYGAAETKPNSILSGDGNVFMAEMLGMAAVLNVTDPKVTVRWTRRVHISRGNLLFADGHVALLDDRELLDAARQTGMASNTLLLLTVKDNWPRWRD